MGHPEPVSVTGIAPQKLAKRTDIRGWWGEWDRDKISVEDFAAGFVRFKNGAALTLECSWLANQKDPEFTRISLVGTEAGADWPEMMVYSEDAGSTTDTLLQFPDDKVPGHHKEIAVFADAILTGKPSPVPAEQSLNVIRILEGLYRSHESGKEVLV
jgi:predicted dehydrogenase